MASRPRLAATACALAALAAGCGGGGDDTGGTTPSVLPAPATTGPVTDQETLRRTAARTFTAWAARTDARILPLRRRIARAQRSGDTAGLADALAAYAAECRAAREALVRIPMPIDAYDPAAEVANALARSATAGDDVALALRAGRRPPPAAARALRAAVAAERAGGVRLRQRLRLPPAPS